MFSDRSLNIKNIFFNAFDELTRCPVALVVFKDMCILKVQFRNISIAGAIAFLMRLILKASATWWLSNRNSIKRVIDIFQEIIDLLDAIYEKSKDPEIKFVRDALLRHLILFNLLLADLLQISNNFFKFSQSRTIQFSSLPSKVDRVNGTPQKIHGKYRNRQIVFSQLCRQLFTCCWSAIGVIQFDLRKRITKAHNIRMKAKLFTKNCSPIPQIFSCRNRCSL